MSEMYQMVKDFLNETKKYIPDFAQNIDISSIFNQALQGNIDNKNLLKIIVINI